MEADQMQPRPRNQRSQTLHEFQRGQKAGAVAAALKGAKDFAAAAKAQGFPSQDTRPASRAGPAAGHRRQSGGGQGGLRTAGRRRQRPDCDGPRHGDREGPEKGDVTPEEFASAKEQFRAEIVNERRTRFFAAYMGEVRRS